MFKQYSRVVFILLQPFDLLQPKAQKAVSIVSIDTQCLPLLSYDPYGNRTHDFTENRHTIYFIPSTLINH